jgi:hypothetical protein
MATFDPNQASFPNNVVQLIHFRIGTLWDNVDAKMRPLRKTDPNLSVGVFGALWQPITDSVEMAGQPAGADMPTLERYSGAIQTLSQSMDEEEGLVQSSALAEAMRTMLYTDNPLRVGLTALQTSVLGKTKRFTKIYIGSQRFLSNEIQGQFIYLSTLEFTFETETH